MSSTQSNIPERAAKSTSSESSSESITCSDTPKYIYYCNLPSRNWQEIAHDLVVKDWRGKARYQALKSHPSQRLRPVPERRRPRVSMYKTTSAPKRMKDSEDYLTTRHANPHTGQVSPSVSTSTVCTPTPNTPGEALELILDPRFPAPEVRARPQLRRANQGRRVSNESAQRWYPEVRGWRSHTGPRAASPRVAYIKANAIASDAVVAEDRFRIPMPSAREPQPYAEDSGYSSAGTEAYDQQRRQSRAVSATSHDQRHLHSVCQASGAQLREAEDRLLQTYSSHADIHVSKRRYAPTGVNNDSRMDALHPNAISFAPFSSPRTPVSANAENPSTAMHTLPRENPRQIHRKPVGSGRGGEALNAFKGRDTTTPTHLPLADLFHINECRRACSLGCALDAAGCACIERRAFTKSNAPFDPTLPSETASQAPPDHHHPSTSIPIPSSPTEPHLTDLLLSAGMGLITACKKIQLPSPPRIELVEILTSEHTTPYQKLCALKALLASLTRIIVALAVLAMLWQVGSAVAHVVEVVVSPLAVPVKILKWVAGVA